jgi:hypothetical protein
VITQSSLFVSFVYKFIIWERNPKKTKKQKPEKKKQKRKRSSTHNPFDTSQNQHSKT